MRRLHGFGRWARLLPCSALILLAHSAVGAAPKVIRSAHFLVYYERWTELPSARDAGRIGEDRLGEIARDLGYRGAGRIVIAVYRDRRDFLQKAGVTGMGPIGVVRYPESIIYLDVSGSRLRLEHMVPHEVTHVLLLRLLGPGRIAKLPLWFNEGLAEYESRVWTGMDDAALGELMRRNRALPLDKLSAAFQGNEEAVADAYLQAWSVVRFLAAREGDGFARRILSALKTRPAFASALAAGTGRDLAGLDRAWRSAASAARHEPPAPLFWGLFTAYVVGAVAAVAVFAKIWLALRRRGVALEGDQAVTKETEK